MQIATSSQRAAVLDAVAVLPKIEAVPGCRPRAGTASHANSQDFEVTRNGTGTVFSITEVDDAPGRLLVSMVLSGNVLGTHFAPPCPSA